MTGAFLTQNRLKLAIFSRTLVDVELGHGAFHPGAVCIFFPNQTLREVLSSQIEEPQKKSGEPPQ